MRAYFIQYPLLAWGMTGTILLLLAYAALEFSRAKRIANQRSDEPDAYATAVVGGPQADGAYTAELSEDGVPYAQVEVGSISSLIERTRP